MGPLFDPSFFQRQKHCVGQKRLSAIIQKRSQLALAANLRALTGSGPADRTCEARVQRIDRFFAIQGEGAVRDKNNSREKNSRTVVSRSGQTKRRLANPKNGKARTDVPKARCSRFPIMLRCATPVRRANRKLQALCVPLWFATGKEIAFKNRSDDRNALPVCNAIRFNLN